MDSQASKKLQKRLALLHHYLDEQLFIRLLTRQSPFILVFGTNISLCRWNHLSVCVFSRSAVHLSCVTEMLTLEKGTKIFRSLKTTHTFIHHWLILLSDHFWVSFIKVALTNQVWLQYRNICSHYHHVKPWRVVKHLTHREKMFRCIC